MIIVCIALIILLGKGTHKAYVHVKRKHQDKKRRKRERVMNDEGGLSSALPQSGHQTRGVRIGFRKQRRHHEQHQHERDPEHSNVNLGISSEARASAETRASHTARHNYHQRARDLGVAISLRQARRVHVEESEIMEELPEYDLDAPRPPSYENSACASPDSLLRGQSVLGSELQMSIGTEVHVEEGDDATLDSVSDDGYALRTSYAYSDTAAPEPVLPPSY